MPGVSVRNLVPLLLGALEQQRVLKEHLSAWTRCGVRQAQPVLILVAGQPGTARPRQPM